MNRHCRLEAPVTAVSRCCHRRYHISKHGDGLGRGLPAEATSMCFPPRLSIQSEEVEDSGFQPESFRHRKHSGQHWSGQLSRTQPMTLVLRIRALLVAAAVRSDDWGDDSKPKGCFFKAP